MDLLDGREHFVDLVAVERAHGLAQIGKPAQEFASSDFRFLEMPGALNRALAGLAERRIGQLDRLRHLIQGGVGLLGILLLRVRFLGSLLGDGGIVQRTAGALLQVGFRFNGREVRGAERKWN